MRVVLNRDDIVVVVVVGQSSRSVSVRPCYKSHGAVNALTDNYVCMDVGLDRAFSRVSTTRVNFRFTRRCSEFRKAFEILESPKLSWPCVSVFAI